MIKRFLIIFVVVFVATFSILNGRFVVAAFSFWLFQEQKTNTIVPVVIPEAKEAATSSQDVLSIEEKTAISSLIPSSEQKIKDSSIKKIPEITAMLSINRLGISAPIVFDSPIDPENVYKNLEYGVVHYSGTPKPSVDSKGPTVIFGHSSAYPWYKGKYGSVFALLGRLVAGDVVQVTYTDGRVLSYRITQSIVFAPFAEDARLIEMEKSEKSTIILISCWPVGTNAKRIAIEAELVL